MNVIIPNGFDSDLAEEICNRISSRAPSSLASDGAFLRGIFYLICPDGVVAGILSAVFGTHQLAFPVVAFANAVAALESFESVVGAVGDSADSSVTSIL